MWRVNKAFAQKGALRDSHNYKHRISVQCKDHNTKLEGKICFYFKYPKITWSIVEAYALY